MVPSSSSRRLTQIRRLNSSLTDPPSMVLPKSHSVTMPFVQVASRSSGGVAGFMFRSSSVLVIDASGGFGWT
jgi:hypothetical protein